MKKKLFRILSLVLSVLMIGQLLPLAVYAAELHAAQTPLTETLLQEAPDLSPSLKDDEAEILGELTEKREANVKYFKMSDGSFSAYVYPQNVHFEENGSFLEIDNTLKSVTVGGKPYFENTAGPMRIRLPEALTASERVEVSTAGHTLSWLMEGTSASVTGTPLQPKSEAELKKERSAALALAATEKEAVQVKNKSATTLAKVKSAVSYESAASSLGLHYELVGDTLKESIVLRDSSAAGTYRFRITAATTTPALQEDGSVLFSDEQGRVIFTLAAPVMWDAAQDDSAAIAVKLEKTRDGYLYTLTPDAAWLCDSARQYPVVIDPTVSTEQRASKVKDTTGVETAGSGAAGGVSDVTYLKVGNRVLSGYGSQRLNAYVYMPLPANIASNDSARILKATLNLYLYREGLSTSSSPLAISAHRITAHWNETNINDNSVLFSDTVPSFDGYPQDLVYISDASPSTHMQIFSFDVTKAAQSWSTGHTLNLGIVLRPYFTPGGDQHIRFYDSDHQTYTATEPFFIYVYRDTRGVEDYWTYTSVSSGRGGVAAVNNFNGNLIMTQPLAGIGGNRMPVSVSMIYDSGNRTISDPGLGWGRRLNYNMLIDDTTIPGYPWYFEDGDGTKHYFYGDSSASSWQDEDGLGLTLSRDNTVYSGGWLMTDKAENKYYFDAHGRLGRITDPHGDSICITYENELYLQIKTITDGAGRVYTFTYNGSGNLIYLTDPTGRVLEFSYYGGHMTYVQFPDGERVSYEKGIFYEQRGGANYGTPEEALKVIWHIDGSYTFLEYQCISGHKLYLTGLSHYTANHIQSENFSFDYGFGNTTVTSLVDATVNATLQFDAGGRTVSVKNNLTGLSAFYRYGAAGGIGADGSSNKLLESSKSISYSATDFIESEFSSLNGFTALVGTTLAVDSVEGNGSAPSLKAEQANAAGGSTGFTYSLGTLPAGQSHTVTAYINTAGLSAADHSGVTMRAYFLQNGTRTYLDETTERVLDSTAEGWIPLRKTFTLDAAAEVVLEFSTELKKSGFFRVDDIALGQGETEHLNYLQNSDFYRNMEGWEYLRNDTVTTMPIIGYYVEGDCYYLADYPTAKLSLRQRVNISGKKGDAFTFGGAAWGNSIPTGETRYGAAGETEWRLRLEFIAADGTVIPSPEGKNVLEFHFGLSGQSQTVSGQTLAPADYAAVYYYHDYDYNAYSSALFDPFLYRETSAQSFAYDENGNATGASDLAERKAEYEYASDDLTKLVSPTGSSFEYYYNDKGELVSSRSSEGVQVDYTYDAYGNATSAEMGHHAYSSAITEGKTYYLRLKESGTYLTVLNGGTANNTVVHHTYFAGTASQRWKLEKHPLGGFYLLPEIAPDLPLDILNGANDDNNIVQIHYNNASTAQGFRIVPHDSFTFKIIPLCGEGDKAVAGTNSLGSDQIRLWTAAEDDVNALWYFEDASLAPTTTVAEGAYLLRARHSGGYLSLKDKNTAVGAYVEQAYATFGAEQKFVLTHVEGDYYTIGLLNTDLLLEVSTEVYGNNHLRIKLSDSTVTDRKLFRVSYSTLRGGFNFLPKWDENRALDIENESCIPGSRLLAATYGNYTCQAFLLEPLSETIRSEAAFTPDGNYLSTVTDATGHTVSYLYNPDGTVKEVTDGKGVKTEYTYDPNNGALLTTRTDGSEVSYTYVDDRLTTITTPSGTVYTFLYDVHGRTSSVTINKVGSTAEPRTLATYTYNSSLTDYNGSPDGISKMTYGNGYVTETEYDATSGLVTEDGKLSYDYVAGTLHSTGDAGDKPTDTYYHYDLAGRLISVARFEAAPTSNTVFSLAYRYRDGSGLLDYTSFSDENFHLKSSWRYGNIDLGEVPDVVYDVLFNDALAVSYTYDGFYRRDTRTLHVGDGITTTYRFMNGAGENTTTTVVESVSEGGFTTSYTYDGNGNILSITRVNDATNEVVDTKVYRYDGKNQLVFEGTSETVGTTYTYDNNGNILSKTDANGNVTVYSYTDPTWGDLLTSYAGESITYDAIGNPLNWRGGATLTWKDGRKLSTYTKAGQTYTYLYDGEGYRVGKTVGNTTYEYTVVDGIIYAETRTTGTEIVTLHYLFDDSGLRIGFVLNGTTTYYYRFNLQGDVTGIYDANGNLIAEYTYDAWGNPITVTGSDLTIANLNPIRYRGYYYDTETGLYHLMSRYYDPVVGRFLNADALVAGTSGSAHGFNQFSYCFNNPVNMEDDTGHWPTWNDIKEGAKKVWGGIKSTAKAAGEWIVDTIVDGIESIETDFGVGWGLDVNAFNVAEAGLSRDVFIGLDDGEIILGNVVDIGVGFFESLLEIGGSFTYISERGGERTAFSGSPQDGPLDMIKYKETTKDDSFTFGLLKINSESEILIGLSGGIHFGGGGHCSFYFNVTEFVERVIFEE